MDRRVVCFFVIALVSFGAFGAEGPFTLSVSVTPADAGHVQLDPEVGPYAFGTNVTLTPVANSCFRFDHWTGDLGGNGTPAVVAMNADKHVTAVFATGLSSVAILSPLPGSTITVSDGANDLALTVIAKTGCTESTGAVGFTLDGAASPVIVSRRTANGLFYVSMPGISKLSQGQHTLVAEANDLSRTVTVQDSVTFTIAKAPLDTDADRNGLPDNSFSALPADGASWQSSVIVPETRNIRLTSAIRWEADGAPGSESLVALAIGNPNYEHQTTTLTVPRALLQEGESGVFIVQAAGDLVTLFSPVETSFLGVEPSAVLVHRGQYFAIGILVSVDGGDSYAPIDASRLDDNPIHVSIDDLDLVGLDPDFPPLFAHTCSLVRDLLVGDKLVGWQGDWNTNTVRNLTQGDTFDADLTSLSVFAPYDVAELSRRGPTPVTTPPSLSTYDYGWVGAGASVDATFTVRNMGGGILSGTVSSTNAPFSIASGDVYNLSFGKSQQVTVRFQPTADTNYSGNLIFSGGGEATLYLNGRGYTLPSLLQCSGGTPSSSGLMGDMAIMGAAALALFVAGRVMSRRRRTA